MKGTNDMTITQKIGYLETIGQALSLKASSLELEYATIIHMLKEINESDFKRLAPYLFTTSSTEEPLVASPIEATRSGYQHLQQLLRQEDN